MVKRNVIGFLFLFGIICWMVPVSGTDIMMFHYNAAHTGDYSPVAGTTGTTVSLLWSNTTGLMTDSSPTVANGMVYIGSWDRNLYAFDAATGVQKWKSPTSYFIEGSPAVVGNVVYAGNYYGDLYAFDAMTGAQKWKSSTGQTGKTCPAYAYGRIYVSTYNGDVIAFSADTGARLWTYPTGTWMDSSPTVADSVVYIGSYETGHNYLYAFDAFTGKLKWKSLLGGASMMISSPAVVNGIVYVGTNDNYVCAFDAATGLLKWKSPTGGSVTSSPAVANGLVYVGSFDHSVYAFDAVTGAQKWKSPTDYIVYSSPAVANGIVYVASNGYNIYAFDAATGTQVWMYTVPRGLYRSSPAVANGVVYVGGGSNYNVIALSTVPAKGRLRVTSVPDGAAIFLNGIEAKEITDTTLDRETGPVTVSVRKNCYLSPPSQDVTVMTGPVAEADFILSPDPACGNPVPEFPSLLVPVVSLIGFIGMVLLSRRK